MTTNNTRLRPRWFRALSSLAAFWAVAVIVVVFAGDALVRLDWRVFGIALVPELLLVWLMWTLLYRPGIRAEADRVVVVNIGRVYEIPWSRVVGITQRLQLVFELDDGSKIAAAGAPFPRKPGIVRSLGGFGRSSRGSAPTAGSVPFDAVARDLDIVRAGAEPSDGPVVRRWDAIPLGIGAVLVIALIVELAVL